MRFKLKTNDEKLKDYNHQMVTVDLPPEVQASSWDQTMQHYSAETRLPAVTEGGETISVSPFDLTPEKPSEEERHPTDEAQRTAAAQADRRTVQARQAAERAQTAGEASATQTGVRQQSQATRQGPQRS